MVRTNVFVRTLLLYWILFEIGFQAIGEQLANVGIFTFERSVLVGSRDRFLHIHLGFCSDIGQFNVHPPGLFLPN